MAVKNIIASVKKSIKDKMIIPMPLDIECIDYEIECDAECAEFVSCSNVLLHIKTEKINGYFCECQRHYDIHHYVKNITEAYYDYILTDKTYADHDKNIVLKSLADENNIDKFINMGENRPASQGGCKSFILDGNPENIGINSEGLDFNTIERLKQFAGGYAWCQLGAYRLNTGIKNGEYQTWCTNRMVATYETAKLLGINRLIPVTRYIRLVMPGHEPKAGCFVEEAEGKTILDFTIDERKAMITPLLQMQLNQLSILDAITHEPDHSPNNYNTIIDEKGMAVGISVFDNNGLGSFSINGNPGFVTYKGCMPIIDSEGIYVRPYIDEKIYDAVKNISKDDIENNLGKYLTKVQLKALESRLNNLLAAIDKSVQQGSTVILKENDWSNETIATELEWPLGKTYLKSFVCDCFR